MQMPTPLLGPASDCLLSFTSSMTYFGEMGKDRTTKRPSIAAQRFCGFASNGKLFRSVNFRDMSREKYALMVNAVISQYVMHPPRKSLC